MGFRELAFSLVIFVSVVNLASSYTVQKTLPSEFMQNSNIQVKEIYGSKVEGGSNHGGVHGGRSHGNGNAGSPNTKGGAAVIPVYVAGAANNNRQHQIHRGAANSNLKKITYPTLLMITLVQPLIQLLFLL